MTASITFDDDDYEIAGIQFAVQYDQTCLVYDSVEFTDIVPVAFTTYAYPVGEVINFVLFSLGVAMPDGAFAEITFTVSDEEDCRGETAEVGFSSSGLAFADLQNKPVTGWTQDGSVKIADE